MKRMRITAVRAIVLLVMALTAVMAVAQTRSGRSLKIDNRPDEGSKLVSFHYSMDAVTANATMTFDPPPTHLDATLAPDENGDMYVVCWDFGNDESLGLRFDPPNPDAASVSYGILFPAGIGGCEFHGKVLDVEAYRMDG